MPSKEELNVATLREAYRLWRDTKGGSIDHWISICAEKIVFSSIIQSADPANYKKLYIHRDEMRVYLGAIEADWEMLEFETEHFVAQGDRVVALGYIRRRHRKNGASVWTPFAHSWRFENGLAVEYYEFFDTARVVEAMKAE